MVSKSVEISFKCIRLQTVLACGKGPPAPNATTRRTTLIKYVIRNDDEHLNVESIYYLLYVKVAHVELLVELCPL